MIAKKMLLVATAAALLLTGSLLWGEKNELAAQIEAKYLTHTGVDRVRITEPYQ